MQILLTNSAEVYEQSNTDKFLTDGFVIVRSSVFDEKQIAEFNAKLNGTENEASRLMIQELEFVCHNFPNFKASAFLETRKSNYDKAYALLYANFKEYITRKYLIELLVEHLLQTVQKPVSFNFNFDEAYQSMLFSEKLRTIGEIEIRTSKHPASKRLLKKVFYTWSRFKRRKKQPNKPGKIRIGLFIFDTANDIELFKTFFKLVKSDSTVHLDIIQIESGISPEFAASALPYACENISVYKLQDFRAPLIGGYDDFNKTLGKTFPQYIHFANAHHQLSSETYSSFINAALSELKPQVVLYDNTGEVGRQLTDTARYHKIKSANVEYGLFSNDFIHMASNIKYDVRFCLGEESISIWKDKKDPTEKHIPVGFLKLDHSKPANTDPISEFENHDFNKIIFFASTWSGTNSLYNLEKTTIVKELIELCDKNSWGLIIKKHPAETDTLIDQMKAVKQSNVFLYQHHEAQLFEILEKCDIVCTQNSSITAEALLHHKPTIFYNKSAQAGLAELIPMSKEPFVYFASNPDQFEEIVTNKIPSLSSEIYENTLSKYLYKTDQKASFRVLEELKQLCK